MKYDPCKMLNLTNACMKANWSYKDKYPKKFIAKTIVWNDCFPQYMCFGNRATARVRKHDLISHWIVPYNSYLFETSNCHFNVEIYSIIMTVKYLYKYIYNDHDHAIFNLISKQCITQIYEIQQF